MAARGRKPNLDKRISDLVAQLKAALIAREQQRLEEGISAQVQTLVAGLSNHGSSAARVALAPPKVSSASERRGRHRRSAAWRRAKAAQMRAYWKARRAEKAGKSPGKKRGRPAKANTPGATAAAE